MELKEIFINRNDLQIYFIYEYFKIN
jgi:hypothetical protein